MPRERDPFWKFVTEVLPNRWKCNFCGWIAAGGITRFKAHFARSPRFGITPCHIAPTQVRSAARQALPGNVEGSSNFAQGLHQLGSASNEDDQRGTSSAAMLNQGFGVISTTGASSLPFDSATNYRNQPAQSMWQQWAALRGVSEGSSNYAQGLHQLGSASNEDDRRGTSSTAMLNQGFGVISGASSLPFDSATNFHNQPAQTMCQQLEALPDQSSNFAQGLHQLGSASNEDDRRGTSSAAMLNQGIGVISTTGASSLSFDSAKNFHDQPAQTMCRRWDNPSLPEFPSDIGSLPWNLLDPPNPGGEMPQVTDHYLDIPNKYTEDQCKGDGGYQSHGRKNGQVGLEAERAVELSNRQGNVEGSSKLTQLVFASNAQRDTSFIANLWQSAAVLSTAVASSSAFVSDLPNQSCSAQTMIQQGDTQFPLQSPQSYAANFNLHQQNLTYPRSSLNLTPEAFANTQCPLNAGVGDLNKEFRQGEMTQATVPLLNNVAVLNEYANSEERSETLHVSKRRRVVDSSNRQGSGEDAWEATSFGALQSQSSYAISTAGASSSALISVRKTNRLNQSHSSQTMIPQRDFSIRPQFPHTCAIDLDMHSGNSSYPSDSLNLTSVGWSAVLCKPNAELGGVSTKIPQGASTDLVLADREPSTHGLTDENMISAITKLEEFIVSGQACMSTLRTEWERRKAELLRSPTPGKLAEVEECTKKVQGILLFLKDATKDLLC